MATIATLLVAATLTPMVDVGSYNLHASFPVSSGLAGNGDSIQCFTVLRNARLFSAGIKTKASLGAGATVKLQRNRGGVRVDLTAATAAATVDAFASSALIGPQDLIAGDIIEMLVGGAGVTAAAAVEVDVLLQH